MCETKNIMKIFDIVNEQDQLVGSASALECHSNPNLIHRVVHFTLVDVQGKILLSKRSSQVKFDSGLWCFMGEHLISGDDYPTAVYRGIEDELGFHPDEGIGEKCKTIFHSKSQTEFARFFVGYYQSGKLKPNPAEIEALKWVTLEELVDNKDNYSLMTQYWVDNCNWKRIIEFTKDYLNDQESF